MKKPKKELYSEKWLKNHCRKRIVERGIIDRLVSIAAGDPVDEPKSWGSADAYAVNKPKAKVPAPMAVQVAAIKELLDRGYDKSAQAVTGADGQALIPYSLTVKTEILSSDAEKKS